MMNHDEASPKIHCLQEQSASFSNVQITSPSRSSVKSSPAKFLLAPKKKGGAVPSQQMLMTLQ